MTQLWRLITCALFFNRLSFGLVFSLYFSYYFMRKAEDVIFPGHKAQFVMLMTWFWVVLLLMATLFGIPFISEAMTMTLLTFWCKSRPHENISLFFGLDMESGYFPFVFVGFSVLMGQPLIVLILGVITGYSYIFIAEFLKTHYGI
jgi:Derlin-2/3